METIEIIEGVQIEVHDRNRIRCPQAALLIGLSRQRVFQLMNMYEKTEGMRGLKCSRDNGILVTSENALREYYYEVMQKQAETDKRYKR